MTLEPTMCATAKKKKTMFFRRAQALHCCVVPYSLSLKMLNITRRGPANMRLRKEKTELAAVVMTKNKSQSPRKDNA